MLDKILPLISVIQILLQLQVIKSFNYEDEGPDTWPIDISTCAGHQQSPIDIGGDDTLYDSSLKTFNFINYDFNLTYNCTHNGHTVVFNPYSNANITLAFNGSNFTETFYLKQFHFHWGENNYQGSEHQIESVKYPLELHLVHQSSTGKLAVLGFLFQLGNSDNPALVPIINGVAIENNQSNFIPMSVNLSSILPAKENLKFYYRYNGSLTTPPCTEGVLWTVFENPINISSTQMRVFHNNSVAKNFRYTQKMYTRVVASSNSIYMYKAINANGCQVNASNRLITFCGQVSLILMAVIMISIKIII